MQKCFGFCSVHESSAMFQFFPNTPIPKIVVPTESNMHEADDRKGHWDFLLIHLFIRRHFDNMHFEMAE